MKKLKKIRFLLLILILPFLIASDFPDQKDNKDNYKNLLYKHQKHEYSKVTKDPDIEKALDIMVGTTGEFSRKAILGNNVLGKPIKIEFKQLYKISPAYANFDALGWKKDSQLTIYINIKHKNAPPEAIASLLSHEALHQDDYNSINEETYAWSLEADVWLQMKKRNPDLNKINSGEFPLVDRENKIGEDFIEGNYTSAKIRELVKSNPAYRDLPESSPGFGENVFEKSA